MMIRKPKVIIIHGWSYSLNKWQDFISLMGEGGYRCELLTVPGLTEGIDKVWNLEDYINWLDAQLSPDEKYILLGHSNGGRIALAYAARFPQKVATLILIASAGIPHNDIRTNVKKFTFRAIAKIGKIFTQSEHLKKILYKLAREQDYFQASPIMRQTMINLISIDLLPTLPLIKIPALLVWGEEDSSTPLSDGQKMHALLSNSKLFTLPSARHSPQFTHPQETVKIIISNLAKS